MKEKEMAYLLAQMIKLDTQNLVKVKDENICVLTQNGNLKIKVKKQY